jgi:glycosyltransferase involved in cell wall biosynthesis
MSSHDSHSTPRTVLYIANSAKIGGGIRVLMHLMKGLDPSRYTPFLVVPAPGQVADWAGSQGIPYQIASPGKTGTPGSGRAATWRQTLAMLPIWLRLRPAIVHTEATHCYRAAGSLARFFGTWRVCHVQFPPTEGEFDWHFRHGPDAVVTCYQAQADEIEPALRKAQPDCRLLAVPNGVELDEGSTASSGTTGAPATSDAFRFGARHVFVIIGHLSEVKGYPTFLRAAARVLADEPDCAFVSVGGETISPGFGATMKALAAELGIADRVHFLGWRDDAPAIMRSADALVLPSLAEALPLAILEAMACGKPVIATPVGGVAEAVVDGETGFLVTPGDVDGLAAAMTRLVREDGLAARMGAAGRRRGEAKFSVKRMVAQIEALYDSLLEPGVRAGARADASAR